MIARRLLRWTMGSALTGAGALSLAAFYDRYWRWRDCFNELGRCYDPISQDVYLEQAGIIWGGFAAIFVLLGAIVLAWPKRP